MICLLFFYCFFSCYYSVGSEPMLNLPGIKTNVKQAKQRNLNNTKLRKDDNGGSDDPSASTDQQDRGVLRKRVKGECISIARKLEILKEFKDLAESGCKRPNKEFCC